MTAVVLAAFLAAGENAAIQAGGGQSVPDLSPLFDLTLQYRPEMPTVVSAEGRAGRLLGSGDGRAEGLRLRGDVRWSIFEVTGEDRCQVELAGFIQTDDGARVEFEARGYGLVPDPQQPNRWLMNAAVRLSAAVDGPYGWANSLLALWAGTFDMAVGRHAYRVYAPRGEGS